MKKFRSGRIFFPFREVIYIEGADTAERRPALEDRELIRRIQNGQKEYLNEIAGKYYDDIYYFCAYQTGNREDAYDLAQETFFKFIRYVESYRYRNLKGYLLTIAMNLCRNYAGRTAGTRIAATFDGWEQPEREAADCAEVSACCQGEYGRLEDHLLLAEMLGRLPEAQREAVLLHHFYGYKNREIARMTGTSSATVKSRIRQGLEKLGKLLNYKA